MAYLFLQNVLRGNTAECVESIFKLHFPDATTVLDATAGAMRFWRWEHNLSVTGIDIDPPIDDKRIIVGDYRGLPFGKGTFDVVTFDPMFIFSRGIRAVSGTARQFMGAEAADYTSRTWSKKKLTTPKNPADLLEHYRRIFEQAAIARMGLILKGQDLIVSNYRDLWHYNVIQLAEEMGFGQPTDYLIQVSKAHRLSDPRWKKQNFYRTANCYYLVYRYGKGRCIAPDMAKGEVEVLQMPAVGEGTNREGVQGMPEGGS